MGESSQKEWKTLGKGEIAFNLDLSSVLSFGKECINT